MQDAEFRAYFDAHWKPESIRIPGAKDHFLGVDIKPIGKPNRTVVGALGIVAADPRVYYEGLYNMVKAGQRVIALAQNTHRRDSMPRLAGIHPMYIEQALNIRDGMDHFNVDTADGFGHSQGGIGLLTAAYLSPDRWNNLILANSAGTMELRPTVFKAGSKAQRFERVGHVIEGFQKSAKQIPPVETIKDPIVKRFLEVAGKVALETFMKHPVHTIQEGLASANADLRWIMRYLRTIHDIRIGMVINTEDHVFRMQELLKTLERDPYIADVIDFLPGAHSQMLLEMPKHIQHGVLVANKLDALKMDRSSRLDKVKIMESATAYDLRQQQIISSSLLVA